MTGQDEMREMKEQRTRVVYLSCCATFLNQPFIAIKRNS